MTAKFECLAPKIALTSALDAALGGLSKLLLTILSLLQGNDASEKNNYIG